MRALPKTKTGGNKHDDWKCKGYSNERLVKLVYWNWRFMYFHVYLIYRFTRTFTDHSSVITKCWGFELQKRKIEPQKPVNPCDTRLCSCIFFVNTLQKASKASVFGAFFVAKMPQMLWVRVWVKLWPTPWPTRRNARKGWKSIGEEAASFPMLRFIWKILSDLRHEVSHLFHGASLHLPCGVRVGAERKAGVVVTKCIADDCRSGVSVLQTYD